MFEDMNEPSGTPIRVEGVSSLEEGFARKILYPVEGQDQPAEMVICRLEGKLHAANSECPHEGGRLAEGPMWDGQYLHCPLHLYRFDPKNGKAVGVACPPTDTYTIIEDPDGNARVWVDPS